MKKDGELWRCPRLRQVKYLNNIVEQDHRNVKRLAGPGRGFGNLWTARRTLQAMSDGDDQQKGMIETSAANFVAGLSSWPLETSAHLLETLHRPTPHFATKRLALAKGA